MAGVVLMGLRERLWDLILGPDPVIRAEAKAIEAVAEQVREETRRAKEKEAADAAAKAKRAAQRVLFCTWRHDYVRRGLGPNPDQWSPVQATVQLTRDLDGNRYWRLEGITRRGDPHEGIVLRLSQEAVGRGMDFLRKTPEYSGLIRPWLDGTLSDEAFRKLDPKGFQFTGELEDEASA